MKKKILLIVLLLTSVVQIQLASAQSAELQQLALDIEKLIQFRQILKDMKTGYTIVTKGYNTIKDLSKGNFNLHEDFLNGLWLVNPSLRKYQRVADIILYQKQILREYKTAFNQFKHSDQFTPAEIDYLSKVYGNLFNQSIQNIEELTLVMTDSKLRMSDDERLTAVNRIDKEMSNELSFLRTFNQQARLLEQQRAARYKSAAEMKQWYNPEN